MQLVTDNLFTVPWNISFIDLFYSSLYITLQRIYKLYRSNIVHRRTSKLDYIRYCWDNIDKKNLASARCPETFWLEFIIFKISANGILDKLIFVFIIHWRSCQNSKKNGHPWILSIGDQSKIFWISWERTACDRKTSYVTSTVWHKEHIYKIATIKSFVFELSSQTRKLYFS